MEGTMEKDCSPLWSVFQQIMADMKNSTPLWEEFVSKATKLHSALKSTLVAVAAFLDAFQKIADAATNAKGATKEIGTALTRMCLRHRAIETRMKSFISKLLESLIGPLTERAEEWRRGACSGAMSREHVRECKRARAELRRRAHDAQRQAKKARRPQQQMQLSEAQRRIDVSMQDVQERKQQLEEMEEKAVKAALIEERSRFCEFVSMLSPVVESEIEILAEVGHLQEGNEQLLRHINEPKTLAPASLQVICDIKSSSNSNWCLSGGGGGGVSSAPHSPTPSSRLGSRKSSLCSISSLNSACSDRLHSDCAGSVSGSNIGCSTPVSNASSGGTIPAQTSANNSQRSLSQLIGRVRSSDSGFRSSDTLPPLPVYARNQPSPSHHGSDKESISSDGTTPANPQDDSDCTENANTSSATWPELKDTAQFERAATAIMGTRPHTISAAFEKGHGRAALSVHTFASNIEIDQGSPRDNSIYARPPLPTRCSSLERPVVPSKGQMSCAPQQEYKTAKPSSLPPHLTKDMPVAVYVNMSELATLAAGRAQQQQQQQLQQQQQQQPQQQHPQQQQLHPHQEKVCSESSASESSLESSSGYGSQGAFASEEHALQHLQQHQETDTEIITLRRVSETAIAAARESFSISLGSLEEAVRGLDEVSEACETQPFATICKSKPSVPKRRPVSMTSGGWSRRGSINSLGKPPPPVRRSSSITRQNRPQPANGQNASEAEHLPPPPAFLLQPEAEQNAAMPTVNVAETVKQLTEIKHMPASPSLLRRNIASMQQNPSSGPSTPLHSPATLSTFHQSKSQYQSSSPNLNPIYGQTGARIMTYVEQNTIYGRKSNLNLSSGDIYQSDMYGETNRNSPQGSTPSTPSYGENSFSSFGPRSEYGQAGYKVPEYGQNPFKNDKKYAGNTIYAQPNQIIQGFNNIALAGRNNESLSPLALRKNIAARSQSADRRGSEQGGLIASLSAKLAPQLSPRTTRRAISTITGADSSKNKAMVGGAVAPAFLDKLSATIQQQKKQMEGNKASTVRHMINEKAQPDPRQCHSSLMEQIKRGATLRRNRNCNDRSAPKIG